MNCFVGSQTIFNVESIYSVNADLQFASLFVSNYFPLSSDEPVWLCVFGEWFGSLQERRADS